MNEFNTPAHIQIKRALVAHEADLSAVPLFSVRYHYAAVMIERCKAALQLSNPVEAWKHFIGTLK